MKSDELIDLLGKHRDEVPNADSWSDKEPSEEDIYVIDKAGHFFGKTYNSIYVSFDKNSIVKSVIVFLNENIATPFYEVLVNEYGKPNRIYKEGKITCEEEKIRTDDGFELSSTSRVLEACNLENSPVLVVWNKDAYDIEVIKKQELNSCMKIYVLLGKRA